MDDLSAPPDFMPGPPDDWFVAELIAVHARLFGYVATMVPVREDAEDLVQRTAFAAWQERARFDLERDFFAWVCGIARNHILHHYRAQKRSKMSLDSDVVEQLADQLVEEDEYYQQRQAALTKCLEKLPNKQRDLVKRYYGSGQSVKDFAGAQELTLESLYKNLQRIRSKLLDCISLTLKQEGIA